MHSTFIEAQTALRKSVKAMVVALLATLLFSSIIVVLPFDCPEGPFIVLCLLVIVGGLMFRAILLMHEAIVINDGAMWLHNPEK